MYFFRFLFKIKTLFSIFVVIFAHGCVQTDFRLFTDNRDPLKERVLAGSSRSKVLIIPVFGIISDIPEFGLIRQKPSMLQEVVSQLNLAAADPDIKAVILKVNSPGGSVTASDIMYHEISRYKKNTGVKVIVSMMDIAASGGYYISLPADRIIAHPTTITGSVGVIFLHPGIAGLLGKIGVVVNVNKSGRNKDMGSPFRNSTEEEKKLFNELIRKLGKRFTDLVMKNRKITPESMKKIATARVFLPEEARELGLIDGIGYLNDAVAEAKKLAGLPDDPRIIVYRRSYYPQDNVYNDTNYGSEPLKPSLIDLGVLSGLRKLSSGFYFLWTPGVQAD
jgi:protease-4